MENNLYYIKELSNPNTLKYSKQDIMMMYSEYNNIDEKENLSKAIILNLDINYSSVQLSKILDYYKIPTRKMRKEEKIEMIINFESNSENNDLVKKRKQLWIYFRELSNDPFFKKYIIGEL